jgi:hypothetical protein
MEVSPTGDIQPRRTGVTTAQTTTTPEAAGGDASVEVVATTSAQTPVSGARPSKTPKEKKARLTELESAIRADMESAQTKLYAIGVRLAEIRREELYLLTNPDWTFGEYCEAELGVSRQHGYRWIQGAEAVEAAKKAAPAIQIQNEAQAREFARLRKNPEALERAARRLEKSDKPLTAISIRAVVNEVAPTKTSDEPRDTKRQKELRGRLPANVKLLRWHKQTTIATIQLDLNEFRIDAQGDQ